MAIGENRFKKILAGSAAFAMLGALLSSYLGPKALAWYFDPPVDIGVNCRPAVEWSMERLQIIQLGGLVLGFVGGLIGMIWMTKKSSPEI